MFLIALPATALGQVPQSPVPPVDLPAHDDIGAPRLVQFRTTEGTWMSLDVSPDGHTIVFDLLGDLYTLPIGGGRARPLTWGTAWDAQPRFSPDGRQIAFVSDRSGIANLWLINAAGDHARQLSKVDPHANIWAPISSPTWAPDGRRVVVSQRLGSVKELRPRAGQDVLPSVLLSRKWLLAEYEVESARMRWVSDTTLVGARATLGPAFAPDGRTLYAAVEPPGWTTTQPATWRIERIHPGTGATAPETAPWLGRSGMRPAVSRDGRWLAYVSVSGARMGLRLRDLETYRERWLVSEKVDSRFLWGNGGGSADRDLAPGYAFTPDSRALIIALGGKLYRVDVATGHRRAIRFVVDVERELAPLTVRQFVLSDTAVHTHSVMQAALSPDGQKVAFSALDRLWVMDLPHDDRPAGRPWRVTADSAGEFYPSWSPDGRWIAYSSWRDGEGGGVRRAWVRTGSETMPAPTEPLSRDTAVYFNTAVAPDGQRVVAVREDLGSERLLTHRDNGRNALSLVTLHVAGGAPTLVRSLPSSVWRVGDNITRLPIEQLYFTTDGSRIHVGLASLAWDGSDWRRTLAVADSFPRNRVFSDVTGVISPNGSRALVTHEYALSEVTLPTRQDSGSKSLNIDEAHSRPFASETGAARRWGRALSPWISWSRDGGRVLFVQGGTLFVGDVSADGWTTFDRVDVRLNVPVDTPRGTLVLRNAQLIPMHESPGTTAEVIPRGDLVVRDHRIVAVGAVGTVPIPPGATVLEMAGKTIIPGYVDIHDHFELPHGIHPQQWWSLLVRLAYGVTAARDPSASKVVYNDVFSYRELERSGTLVGPRVFSTGIDHLRSDRPIRTLDDARALVRPTAEYFGAETFKEYSVAPWTSRRLIAAAATEAGLNATLHGDHLRAIVDGFSGVEHNLLAPLYDDVLTFIARSGVTLTNTFSTTAGASGLYFNSGHEPLADARMRRFIQPGLREALSAQWFAGEVLSKGHPEPEALFPVLSTAAGVVARGGRIGMGMHGNIPGLGIHYEMWLHAMGGMPNAEILRSATIVGATAIGHARDFGSIEVGKLADLQILDRNPLEDIRNTTSIRYVMKNGRLYQADDLTEIWPRHRPLPAIYLWDDAAEAAAATK